MISSLDNPENLTQATSSIDPPVITSSEYAHAYEYNV